MEAAAVLLDLLSDIADKRNIKVGFNRAKDRGIKHQDLNDQELHFELLAWSDADEFWNNLPDMIPLSDGSGEIAKEELHETTLAYCYIMMREVSANL